jgi:hypothetical protein
MTRICRRESWKEYERVVSKEEEEGKEEDMDVDKGST